MIFSITVIMLAGFLIALFEVPGLIRKMLWGELVTFSILLLAGLAQAVFLTLR